MTLSPRASFWTAASVAGVAMWSSAAPTIVYPLYEASWGFTNATSGLVFAVYPIVLIPVLLIFGSLSDYFGRRYAILLGLGALAIGTLIFGVATGLPAVLIGGAFMGIGVGLSLSPAAAAMVEMGGPERAPRASSMLTASTALGLALATIVGGALVQYAPNPLHLTFFVFLAVILAVSACAAFLPRIKDEQATPWRPRMPHVPAGIVRPFFAGTLAITVAYSIGAVFLSLGAQISVGLLQSSNAFIDGSVIAVSAVAIGIVAIVARPLPARTAVSIGPAAILIGMILLVVSGIAESMPIFVVSSIITGGGYSLMYAGGMGILTATAPTHHRAAVIAAAFTLAYVVQAAVALGLGQLATAVGLLAAIEVGGIVLVGLSVAAALVAHFPTPFER